MNANPSSSILEITNESSNTLDLAKLLNPEQYKAVIHSPGPQLILAGAGSGKTRVLTYKIAWLMLEKGFRPHQILAVTFTNKAAGEMKARIGKLMGSSLALPWVGTFHSICGKLLRFHASLLGFTSNFTIYDTDDQKRFIRKLVKASGEASREDRFPDTLRWYISQQKNLCQSPDEARAEATGFQDEQLAKFYRIYQEGLKKNNAMDFDDLILHTIALLQSNAELRDKYRESFRYVLVDEYQDTNRSQYLLVKLLTGSHCNLVVVGDDDQSIYGWRGADINNILSFQKDYPATAVAKLEQNYRSSANILKVAASVICKNTKRMQKNIWTQNPDGSSVQLFVADDEIHEASWVASELQSGKIGLRDTAIFYRTNAQSRVFEDELRRRRIPYLIVGGLRFYDRKEVKDLLAYLQVLNNSKDSVALGRIINVPKRKIGDKTLDQCADLALSEGITLWEAVEKMALQNPGKNPEQGLNNFVTIMHDLQADKQTMPLPELIDSVLERSGYRKFLEKDDSDDAENRLDNLNELVSAAEDFLERNGDGGLNEFLQEVSLISDTDSLKESNEAVAMMTVHSAKGLEFKQVFATGLEEGLFPLMRQDGDGDVEEERRLFYVAATRAMEQLVLSMARFRRRYAYSTFTESSRFLSEMDSSVVEHIGSKAQSLKTNAAKSSGTNSQQSNSWTKSKNAGSQSGSDESSESGENFPEYEDESQEQQFFVGQKVIHGRFGMGKILALDGRGDNAKVDVLFKDLGRKRILLKYTHLEVVE